LAGQKLFQSIFTNCDADSYAPTIKKITEYCLNVTVTSAVRAGVDKVLGRSSLIQLNVNLGTQASEGVSPAGNNMLGCSQKAPEVETKPGSTIDSSSTIEMNINLNYGSGTPGISPNPAVYTEHLIGGTSPATNNTNVLADCPPDQGNTGASVTSGPPNPAGPARPFVTSGPSNLGPGAGGGEPPCPDEGGSAGSGNGNGLPPITVTQFVESVPSPPPGMYGPPGGSGNGNCGDGLYGDGNGGFPEYGGAGSGSCGPPFPPAGNGGAGNGAVCTIVETTTLCLPVQASPVGMGSGMGDMGGMRGMGPGNGNGNLRMGNGNSEPPCPSPGDRQGPFVETVFIMGTPSPLAIVPTTCPNSPPLQPPPPPARAVVTAFAPAPPPPPPPPLPLMYGPPPTPFALFDAKASFIGDTVAAMSFLTVTVPVQQAEQTPDATSYGDPGSGGSGAAPGSETPPGVGDGGAAAPGDGAPGLPGGPGGAGASAPLPLMSPSPRDSAAPAQVTASAAERRRPSILRISLLVAALTLV
jgi:hypothetical protein